MPENSFATIKDMHEALASLIERGLGDLAVQILVAPDSTLQALAMTLEPGYSGKPALMIDVMPGQNGRMPACIISADRLTTGNTKPVVRQ